MCPDTYVATLSAGTHTEERGCTLSFRSSISEAGRETREGRDGSQGLEGPGLESGSPEGAVTAGGRAGV